MKLYLFSSRFLYAATNQLWSSFLHEATGFAIFVGQAFLPVTFGAAAPRQIRMSVLQFKLL
jgi:hypothetical protein